MIKESSRWERDQVCLHSKKAHLQWLISGYLILSKMPTETFSPCQKILDISSSPKQPWRHLVVKHLYYLATRGPNVSMDVWDGTRSPVRTVAYRNHKRSFYKLCRPSLPKVFCLFVSWGTRPASPLHLKMIRKRSEFEKIWKTSNC